MLVWGGGGGGLSALWCLSSLCLLLREKITQVELRPRKPGNEQLEILLDSASSGILPEVKVESVGTGH